MRKINKRILEEEYQLIDKDEFWAAWRHFGNKEEYFKIHSHWIDGNLFNGYYISWELILKISLDKDSAHLHKFKKKVVEAAEEDKPKKRGRPPKKGKDNEDEE